MNRLFKMLRSLTNPKPQAPPCAHEWEYLRTETEYGEFSPRGVGQYNDAYYGCDPSEIPDDAPDRVFTIYRCSRCGEEKREEKQ